MQIKKFRCDVCGDPCFLEVIDTHAFVSCPDRCPYGEPPDPDWVEIYSGEVEE